MTLPKHDKRDTSGRFTPKNVEPPRRKPTRPGRGMGNYGSMTTPALNRKKSQHVIDDISFSNDYIVCVCAWKGRIDDYQRHRKEAEPATQGGSK